MLTTLKMVLEFCDSTFEQHIWNVLISKQGRINCNMFCSAEIVLFLFYISNHALNNYIFLTILWTVVKAYLLVLGLWFWLTITHSQSGKCISVYFFLRMGNPYKNSAVIRACLLYILLLLIKFEFSSVVVLNLKIKTFNKIFLIFHFCAKGAILETVMDSLRVKRTKIFDHIDLQK